jgi:hypothetical protein
LPAGAGGRATIWGGVVPQVVWVVLRAPGFSFLMGAGLDAPGGVDAVGVPGAAVGGGQDGDVVGDGSDEGAAGSVGQGVPPFL